MNGSKVTTELMLVLLKNNGLFWICKYSKLKVLQKKWNKQVWKQKDLSNITLIQIISK